MSWHLSQCIQVSSLTHFSHPRVQSKRYAPHQFSRVFSRGLTLTLHIITTSIYVFLCCCSLSDSLEHLAKAILFHMLSCNSRGRKCIEKPQAKRLKVNINTFPCLSLVCFKVITRSACTFLDIQGRVNAGSLWLMMQKENARKQKRNFDAECRSMRRSTGCGGRTASVVWRPINTVNTHRGWVFIIIMIVSSTPLVESSLMVPLGKSLLTVTAFIFLMHIQI